MSNGYMYLLLRPIFDDLGNAFFLFHFPDDQRYRNRRVVVERHKQQQRRSDRSTSTWRVAAKAERTNLLLQ